MNYIGWNGIELFSEIFRSELESYKQLIDGYVV